MKYKIKLYQDPLAEIGEFKFSDLFEEGSGPELSSDFTVQVYRAGHHKVRGGLVSLLRTLDFKKIAKLQKLTEIAADDNATEEESEAAAKGINEALADLPGDQMQAVIQAVTGGNVATLVHDILGIPLIVEGEDEPQRVNLSELEGEDRDEVLRQVLAENEHLEPMIRQVSQQREEEFQSYIKQAKKDSVPTSPKRPGARTKTDTSSTEPANEQTSLSVVP